MIVFALAFLANAALAAEPPSCALPPIESTSCVDGALGNATPASFGALTSAEVRAIVDAAAASLDDDAMTVAVVDRAGRVLALYRKPGADPANDDRAVGVARTAAFFSHDQAPLSSRTVRSISGVHFPAGVTNAHSGALYGIENTNRGCDLNVTFNDGKCVPRARSLNGAPCASGDTAGCGPGIVTGKEQPYDGAQLAVNAGGIPLYRLLDVERLSDGRVVGGIGVVGIDGDSQRAEFAAVTGAFGALNAGAGAIVPVPRYPLPYPGNVFIEGIRLPFLGSDQKLRFNGDGVPVGLVRLRGTRAGSADGAYVIEPQHGGCVANEYLVGPLAGSALTREEVDAVVQRAIRSARRTRSAIRLPLDSYARMVIAVADLDGSLLALYRMPDATVFSIDVAAAKARNVIWFSGNGLPGIGRGTTVSNGTIGFGAQPFFPPGLDSPVFRTGAGPFFDLFVRDLATPCSQGSQPQHANQNGIVFFPGSTPLARAGRIVAGLGISGDGVEQDDYVSVLAAGELLPPRASWADRIVIDRVRLPMFKFPRQPEGVTECGGKPCS